MAMSSPMDGATPPPGFGAPGSSPGAAPGFGAPAAAPPGGGFGAPPAQPQAGFGGPTAAAAPVKKKKNPLMFVAIGCVAILALGCIAGNVYYFVFAPSSDDVENILGDAADNGGGSDLCSRASDCCEAYVNAITEQGTPGMDVQSTCAAVRMAGAADATCQSAIDGYRQSLQAIGHDIPTSCQ